MKIFWNKNIEPELKTEIEKYLNEWLWLIPKWCQHLYVNLYDASGDTAIATLVSYEYRRVSIDFYTCWLNSSPEIKRDNVIHECVHALINNLYHEARQIVISKCGTDEDFKDYAFERLRLTVESVTQDFTFALNERFETNER